MSEFVIRNQTEKEEQLLVVLISTQAVHLFVYFVHAFIALLRFSKHKKIIQIVNLCVDFMKIFLKEFGF